MRDEIQRDTHPKMNTHAGNSLHMLEKGMCVRDGGGSKCWGTLAGLMYFLYFCGGNGASYSRRSELTALI